MSTACDFNIVLWKKKYISNNFMMHTMQKTHLAHQLLLEEIPWKWWTTNTLYHKYKNQILEWSNLFLVSPYHLLESI